MINDIYNWFMDDPCFFCWLTPFELWIGTQVMWLGTIALILAVYYLGIRKKADWYLAIIGGITTMFANAWVHLVRGVTTDYILGAAFGLIIVVLLLIPGIKQSLYTEVEAA